MRDPKTNLRIINADDVDPALKKAWALVVPDSEDQVPLIYFFGLVVKKPKFGFNTRRVVAVSLNALFVLDEAGKMHREIQIYNLKEVIITGDEFVVLKVPVEHDLIFRMANPQELDDLIHALRTTWAVAMEGKELDVFETKKTLAECAGMERISVNMQKPPTYQPLRQGISFATAGSIEQFPPNIAQRELEEARRREEEGGWRGQGPWEELADDSTQQSEPERQQQRPPAPRRRSAEQASQEQGASRNAWGDGPSSAPRADEAPINSVRPVDHRGGSPHILEQRVASASEKEPSPRTRDDGGVPPSATSPRMRPYAARGGSRDPQRPERYGPMRDPQDTRQDTRPARYRPQRATREIMSNLMNPHFAEVSFNASPISAPPQQPRIGQRDQWSPSPSRVAPPHSPPVGGDPQKGVTSVLSAVGARSDSALREEAKTSPVPTGPHPDDRLHQKIANMEDEMARLRADLAAAVGAVKESSTALQQRDAAIEDLRTSLKEMQAREVERSRSPLKAELSKPVLSASVPPVNVLLTGGQEIPIDSSKINEYSCKDRVAIRRHLVARKKEQVKSILEDGDNYDAESVEKLQDEMNSLIIDIKRDLQESLNEDGDQEDARMAREAEQRMNRSPAAGTRPMAPPAPMEGNGMTPGMPPGMDIRSEEYAVWYYTNVYPTLRRQQAAQRRSKPDLTIDTSNDDEPGQQRGHWDPRASYERDDDNRRVWNPSGLSGSRPRIKNYHTTPISPQFHSDRRASRRSRLGNTPGGGAARRRLSPGSSWR